MLLAEATVEVAGRGRVRDRGGAHGIEEGFIVAAKLDVIEGPPAAQRIVRDVQDVVGLMVRPLDLQQFQALVDVPDQT